MTSRIEVIKRSPSLQGCGKDTIIAIMIIIAVIGSIAFTIVHHWKFITGLIEPFFEWFQENLYQGMVLYTAIYTVMTVIFIPTTFLTYGGALAFT
jgi:uncharacterized membrane protein YdjX (TVP38/TMEM64 family)